MRERERERDTTAHVHSCVCRTICYKHLVDLPALLTMMDAVPVAASGVCPTKSVTDRKT